MLESPRPGACCRPLFWCLSGRSFSGPRRAHAARRPLVAQRCPSRGKCGDQGRPTTTVYRVFRVGCKSSATLCWSDRRQARPFWPGGRLSTTRKGSVSPITHCPPRNQSQGPGKITLPGPSCLHTGGRLLESVRRMSGSVIAPAIPSLPSRCYYVPGAAVVYFSRDTEMR